MYSRRYNVRSKQSPQAAQPGAEKTPRAEKATAAPGQQVHENVMELLVSEEVYRQLQALPPKLAQYMNPVEIETYALNRLPPLYASSEEGWKHQQTKGHDQLLKKVEATVRQAFAAIQQDPIRLSTPLKSTADQENNQPKIAPRQPLREEMTERKQQDKARWRRDQYYRQ